MVLPCCASAADTFGNHFFRHVALHAVAEIVVDRLDELRHRKALFFKNQLFDRIERVRHIGDAEALRPRKVIDRAALLHALPL